MGTLLGRVEDLARRQHGVVAVWQLQARGWTSGQVKAGLRGLRRLHRGVCAVGDLTELGWFMAAALAGGPGAVVSHLSALQLMELRPHKPGDVHVTLPRRGGATRRDGIVFHRPRTPPQRWTYEGIPVTSPTQSLHDAGLRLHEQYRVLEQAERRGLRIDLQNGVAGLRRAIRGYTRSDSEALFLWHCHTWGLPLPLVNQYLNGFETDFHWPDLHLVVEVDGWEHHKERKNFNSDRYRGLVHRARGYEVVRISADHVHDEPELVLDALTAGRVGR